jgi:hypothetical protein
MLNRNRLFKFIRVNSNGECSNVLTVSSEMVPQAAAPAGCHGVADFKKKKKKGWDIESLSRPITQFVSAFAYSVTHLISFDVSRFLLLLSPPNSRGLGAKP